LCASHQTGRTCNIILFTYLVLAFGKRGGDDLQLFLEATEDVDALGQPGGLVGGHGSTLHALEALELRGDLFLLALHFGDVGPLLVGAALGAVDVASTFECFLDPRIQSIVGAAAVVGFAGLVSVLVVLDCGVSTNLVLAAKILLFGAINIKDANRGGISVFCSELVISRLHRFAMSSPRGLELNYGVLARVENFSVEICVDELLGGREGREGCGEAKHDVVVCLC